MCGGGGGGVKFTRGRGLVGADEEDVFRWFLTTLQACRERATAVKIPNQ